MILLLPLAALATSAEVMPPTPDMLPAYVRSLASKEIGKLRARVAALRSTSDWQRMKKELLRSYSEAIGPFPKRTPLNAKTTGKIEVPGVVIEKVVFESRPRFYVTANLYLPKGRPGVRVPAVLLLSGHYEGAKSAPDSPHERLAFSLASQGVATLAMDPLGQGERKFFLDAERGPTESCVTEHCMLGYPCLLTGTNVLQYLAWDAIRAGDYLQTRPEVDPKRIAVTGISGGGTQTFSVAPLDGRLAFAAPTCFVTSRLAFMNQAADAEQCLHGAIANGLDHSMMIALCAPRTYQVQATRGDLFPIQGVRDSVALARVVYRLLGAEDRLLLAEDDGGHDYTAGLRSAFYRSLARCFMQATPVPPEPAFEVLAPERLACTPTGNVKTSYPNARWVGDFNRDRARSLTPKRRPPTDAAGFIEYQKSIRSAVRKVLGKGVDRPSALPPAAILRGSEHPGSPVTETFWVQTEPGITVVCKMSRPEAAGKRPAVILLGDSAIPLSPGGSNALREIGRTRLESIEKGFVVVELEVRGTGPSAISGPPKTVWDLVVGGEAVVVQDLSMCGTSLFAGRVKDVLRCIDWTLNRPEVDGKGLTVVGWGQGGLLAMYAAALDGRIARCAAIGSLATYRSLVETDRFAHPPSTFLWNVLTGYDLPELAACIAPRPLLLSALVDAQASAMPLDRIRADYKPAAKAYEAAGAGGALRICSTQIIVDWMPRR